MLGREVHLVDETCVWVCVYDIEHRCTPYSTTQSPVIHLFRPDEGKETRDLQQWRGMI